MIMRIKVRFYFGHVRTYSWLHKFRNTQWKIYGTYLGKIYGRCKEYIRNIHEYLWYQIIRNTGAAFGGATMGRPPSAAALLGLCFCQLFWSFYIIDIYGYSLYIPYIFHIYFLAMWSMFSLVCVLNLWSQEEVRTCPNSDFWSNFARFGSRNGILTKWHNDSGSFLLEKLKIQVILTKNLNIWPQIPKIPKEILKIN